MCIQGKDIKFSQFADDTNLTLDWSEDSFKHTIHTLKLYEGISGLNINFDQTNAVWFGSLKYYRRKYSNEYRTVWDPGIFRILGIKFSVEVESMVQLNFGSQIFEIQKLRFLGKCKLTLFGKIAVIKSMAVKKKKSTFIALLARSSQWVLEGFEYSSFQLSVER